MLTRPTAWSTVFNNQQPLEVEIGFGNGEFLAKLCAQYPMTNFIGFEQYCERIHRTLRKLSREASGNVRVMRLDAKAGFERYIAPRSVNKIYCLYPPPWPKKSDAKHRLLTHAFLKTLNNRLVDGGVFLLVTDWKPYTEWLLEQYPGTGFDLDVKVIAPNYGTKFENKWVEGGQREFYEMTFTKKYHQDVPLKEDVAMQTHLVNDFDPDHFILSDTQEPGIAVSLKDFIYDSKKKIAMVHAVISDEGIVQHIRIIIVATPKGWRVQLAEGSLLMPTQGVALALAHTALLAQQSALKDKA